MDKKIPALVVLAAFTTEAVLNDKNPKPHTENVVAPPANKPVTMSSGAPRARSAKLSITPNEDKRSAEPHIERSGDGPSATDLDLTQRS
jgi:hypothetical protein